MERAPRLSASLIEDRSELGALSDAWDALAVRARSPFGAPAWALAWWKHMAPRQARLAAVAVHDRSELVGLAPLYATRRLGVTELRLLSSELVSRLGILAEPGREREVAAAIAAATAAAERPPNALRWEGIDAASQWPLWISAAWPARRAPSVQREVARPGPVLRLDQHSSYADWLAAKSRHFRRRLKRKRRLIEERGAAFRLADRGSLARDLSSFARLHTDRWRRRGGSLAVNASTMSMLRDAGEALVDSGRFRLWVIDDPDGEAISAELLLAAGGEVASWNGGFDEAWAELSPGLVALTVAIEDAYERGDSRLDLGGGAAEYKDRLADADLPVAWSTSYLSASRYPLIRLRRLPEQTARRCSGTARELLGPVRYNRVRRLLHR